MLQKQKDLLVWFEKGERAEYRRAVTENNIEVVVIASYLLFLFPP